MNSREILRKQLDARLRAHPRGPSPKGGWIRTIRQALGMTMAQLARRLEMSAPAVADLEARESRGTISIAKLQAAANAMDCELVIAVVPRIPLTEMVRRQATVKAQEEHERLLHTMKLEDQESGVAQVVDMNRSIQQWMDKRTARLWD